MKYLYLLLATSLIFVLWSEVHSQTGVNFPTEIKTAYQNGTRSISGMPGVKYWQNTSKYKISAELLSEESLLKGEEHITYFNNSPDSLDRLVIRLYQNISAI